MYKRHMDMHRHACRGNKGERRSNSTLNKEVTAERNEGEKNTPKESKATEVRVAGAYHAAFCYVSLCFIN